MGRMKTLKEKLIQAIGRGLNAEYSFPTWLWASVSLLVGVLLLSLGLFAPVEYNNFLQHLPFGGLLFGPLQALAALLSMYGMVKKKPRYVRVAAMTSFCSWIFVGYAFYATGGFINVVLLPMWLLLFWGYKYLASFERERRGL